MKLIQLFIFLFFLCSCNTLSSKDIPSDIKGKVVGVKDGDTIEILFNGKPLTIRFEHIDCPEVKKQQPFGKAAKLFTSKLCFGQTVTVLNHKKFDRYKRLIGVVFNEMGQNINKELVKAGLAWHFKKYSDDQEFAALENVAKVNKVGLWADRDPTPPWEWRKPNKL